MSNKLGVNIASYNIRTFDGRVLAYGPTDGDKGTIPPPPKPVIAYPAGSVQPQQFDIAQVEQDNNRYYINYLIERDNLLYDQVTAPQKWIITLVPKPGRVVFTIAKEGSTDQWVAPPAGEEGQIRVATIDSGLDPNALFELVPATLKSS